MGQGQGKTWTGRKHRTGQDEISVCFEKKFLNKSF